MPQTELRSSQFSTWLPLLMLPGYLKFTANLPIFARTWDRREIITFGSVPCLCLHHGPCRLCPAPARPGLCLGQRSQDPPWAAQQLQQAPAVLRSGACSAWMLRWHCAGPPAQMIRSQHAVDTFSHTGEPEKRHPSSHIYICISNTMRRHGVHDSRSLAAKKEIG